MKPDGRYPAPPANSSFMTSDPLRQRNYIHFDERPPRHALASLVTDKDKVAKWQFFPLLSTEIRSSKIKFKNTTLQTFQTKEKSRPISYASHRDAALYAHYAQQLNKLYEKVLIDEGISENVTAFRSASGKCNVHFANESFEWIGHHAPCVALAFDISGFFDSLDHALLKRMWSEVLGSPSLPADHYAIYRSLTRFTLVSRDEVYAAFKISRHNPRANGRKRICSAAEFRMHVADKGLIRHHADPYGIPQGTPVSAVLSNIYLLDFDRILSNFIAEAGGFYRRYCDDILCVVPPDAVTETKEKVQRLVDAAKLKIQHEKTGEVEFDTTGIAPKPLQYLGLTYDGTQTLLRPGGIGRYYARMRAGVKLAGKARAKKAEKLGILKTALPIRRSKLYRLYSYRGRRNFLSYALRASRITGSEDIKHQVSRHWPALQAEIKDEDK